MDLLFSWLSRDGKLLLAAKIVRTFAYGFLSVILAIYLKLIGFDDVLIGLVLTVTLVNSVIFTLIASFYADRIGRRRILVIYAALMSISGAIFVTTENHVMLIIAAFIGTINVTGSETGAFLTIEQSILPQTVKNIKKRNIIFAIYNMVGTFAMSAGVLLSGLPTIIQQQFGGETLNQIDSIRPLFILYSLLGIVVIGIYLLLSNRIEVQGKIARPLTQTLSPMSKNIVGKLSGLFAIDSFAGGFVIQSIVSFWFFTKFGADLTTLSYIFSVAGILTAFSFIVSAKIADKVGLINTMVFTHIPSNILIILVAFAPSLSVAIAFYLIRMALSQMDVPTRQSYIVAVVNEEERTAAAGITNISRNISQAISPSLTGIIINTFTLSTPFIIGGLLKIAYDIALYVNFRKIKPPEEELKEDKE
ncbi:MAG TPA: MFS transporter [Nitrososphaeraceae archaeon]|jgi:MFS family permease|nr:MFS transporter [Nitrososphaeraceae archaeon]